MGVLNKLLDFGFDHIDIWRSEPMSLAQVGSFHGSRSITRTRTREHSSLV